LGKTDQQAYHAEHTTAANEAIAKIAEQLTSEGQRYDPAQTQRMIDYLQKVLGGDAANVNQGFVGGGYTPAELMAAIEGAGRQGLPGLGRSPTPAELQNNKQRLYQEAQRKKHEALRAAARKSTG